MRLFIGGFAQGKTEYVRKLYPEAKMYDESSFEGLLKCNTKEAVILNHTHLCVREMMLSEKSEQEIKDYFEIIKDKFSNIIFISDEIGNGIVPMDAFERDYRELTGRILIDIAKKSEGVERIICQIPMKLK